MNEPQVWTALGILAAALTGMITVVTQMMMRAINARFDSVNDRFDALSTNMNVKFDSLRTEMELRFQGVDQRFNTVERRLDGLDGDVQALARRVMPE